MISLSLKLLPEKIDYDLDIGVVVHITNTNKTVWSPYNMNHGDGITQQMYDTEYEACTLYDSKRFTGKGDTESDALHNLSEKITLYKTLMDKEK